MIDGDQIINYLNSKGKIKATLLFKLEKMFCINKPNLRISETELLDYLFLMMQERIIEILIVDPFEMFWEKQYLTKLKYLEDGNYLIRKFFSIKNKIIKSYKENDYFFNSRSLAHGKNKDTTELLEKTKEMIIQFPEIKKKTIIFYPLGSEPLNIYEPYEGNYQLNFSKISVDQNNSNNPKFSIPYEQQKLNLEIIRNYRSKFMCFYITLIEALQESIVNLQGVRKKTSLNTNSLKDFLLKFACYCISFVKSDWVEIDGPNPYRWESFFKSFDIPLKTIDINFKSVNFYGRTFEAWNYFKFCIFIDKKYKEDIKYLEELGYQELKDENFDRFVAIGLNLETFIPCPSIEHFYFLYKYIVYFHLFRLFFHSFQYIQKIKKEFNFTSREENLYKIFLPVMQPLFNVQPNKITDKLVFNYYTYNSDELELIYNKFLMKNAKNIEKKLFTYFLIKYPKNTKK